MHTDPREPASAAAAPSNTAAPDAPTLAPDTDFPELHDHAVAVRITRTLAGELQARPGQVSAAVALLDEGATVPFIARYRKEATDGLDDVQLRLLEERLRYLRELEERRATVVRSIAGQGKLTGALKNDLFAADTQARIEDLYAPYKPKRRTRAMIAREAGLQPLADLLLAQPEHTPEIEAERFINAEAGFADTKAVLQGARDILTERFAEEADLVTRLRERMREQGWLRATLVEGKAEEGAKFSDYFAHTELLSKVPSHRALAMLRGRNEGVLRLDLSPEAEPPENPHAAPFNAFENAIAGHFGIRDAGRPADRWLLDTVRWTWRTKLSVHLQLDLLGDLRERAEIEAIRVFASNLKDLLLAAPAGPRVTMGLDPGLRTGVKLAVIDGTGKVVATDTLFPHAPRNDWDGSIAKLARLCSAHGVQLIAIGNGTASRETEQLARDLVKRHPELTVTPVVVSEAGASVYSASATASEELPELDVSLRGAVSIARRLQDPLAELVKIDPKSIGVGQYQHDVNQVPLARALDAVVEDCVNAVGIDVNTASPSLLARVSGLNPAVARNIVERRNSAGPFRSRSALREVPRLGEKTFEQCAGFLRVTNGDNPLDASAVHPEAYGVVERMLARLKTDAPRLIGNREAVRQLDAREFVDERFGLPTVNDILRELEKPGRDPRPEFRTAKFAEGVTELSDLTPGMILEGTVTNVTAFGAFIDIGVHQDGLAHVSELSDRFVKEPREVVKAGDIVKARVLEVDLKRRRIALSLRSPSAASGGARAARGGATAGAHGEPRGPRPAPGGGGPRRDGANAGRGFGGSGGGRGPAPNNALADALARARAKG